MNFRNNGALGALLDEYEKAINELKLVLTYVSQEELIQIVDSNTKDKDCQSIQSILAHVVGAGYNYVIEIRNWMGEDNPFYSKITLNTAAEYCMSLDQMFAFNDKLSLDYPQLNLEEYESEKKIKVRWGQLYDVEQLLEHAIVHILRHRRQIERFKVKIHKHIGDE